MISIIWIWMYAQGWYLFNSPLSPLQKKRLEDLIIYVYLTISIQKELHWTKICYALFFRLQLEMCELLIIFKPFSMRATLFASFLCTYKIFAWKNSLKLRSNRWKLENNQSCLIHPNWLFLVVSHFYVKQLFQVHI